MAKQELMWTALPNGFDSDGNLRVSALLSPRLTPDADQILKPFADLIDWPGTLRQAKFIVYCGSQSVSIAGDDTASAARVDEAIDVADSATWQALVSDTTYVAGYVPEDHTADKVLSYDTTAVHSFAQTLYSSLGRTTSEAKPKVGDLLKDPNWAHLIGAVSTIDRLSANDVTRVRDVERQRAIFRNGNPAVLAAGVDPVTDALSHAQLFHTPPSAPSIQDYAGAPIEAVDPRQKARWLTFQRASLPAPADFVNMIDFHQIVAAMNQYPKLLRRLGLVVDFVIPANTFTNSANQQLWVECVLNTPDAAGVTRANASPRTRVRLMGGSFDILPRPVWSAGDYLVQDGLLNINPDLFSVLQCDVDGAALKLMSFARSLRKMQSSPELQADAVTKHQKDSGVPALRNAGLMLAHRRRAMFLSNAFTATKAKHTAVAASFADPAVAGPDLYAQDLIRGWRIDIWDSKTRAWRSLCERLATYTVGGGITIQEQAEGIVRLASTKAADGSNQDIHYLHEALVSWTGWSLVARQPGQVVTKDDQVGDANQEVPPGLNLATDFQAKPGSLPRLRYGRRYWIRARMVDIAANSLPPAATNIAGESPEKFNVPYTRFEPVQGPAIALVSEAGTPEKPLEGESMQRAAIRTFNDTPDKNTVATDATARRFGVPARSSVREAELHGMLDKAGAVDGSSGLFDLLAKKDAALDEVKLITAGPLTDPGATVETSYAVLDSGATEIPYLTDPLCVNISARIYDHPAFPNTNIITIPVYNGGNWPEAAPFTIRIFEDPSQAPHFDADTRILQIPLPKATRATLRLSSQLADDALALMGIWSWIPAADQALLAARAKSGQHWMLTPWRELELVHAVQKPLIASEMKMRLVRQLGETRALPSFSATCSIASTARVDLQAHWHEPDADEKTNPIAADRERADHAFSVKITDPNTYASADHEPGATGIPEHATIGTDLISVGLTQAGLAQLGLLKYHEYNDTRYRRVEYWLEATTRFREYMPAAILTGGDDQIKVTGPAVVTWVPNSTPPVTPQILYVVPTFGWTSTTDAQGNETRWRRGGGLRVYLDRPWNTSGYGEMLAVVIPPASFAGDPNTTPAQAPLKKFVTQWGNDPIWSSNFPAGAAPKLADFPLARTAPDSTGAWLPSFAPATEADQAPGAFLINSLPHPGVVPAGDGTQFVDIAPHDVAYDADRQLWYADIEVRTGATYFPFIRLALAKYQPTSVPYAHLSNIALADFMALAPDRWLSVTHGANPAVRNVSVFGWNYSGSSGHNEAASAPSTVILNKAENPVSVSSTSIVEVWVEKLNPALGEFGWQPDTASAVTTAPPPAVLQQPRVDPRFLAMQADLTAKRQFEQVSQALQHQVFSIWPRLWQGSVALPASRAAGDRYRLAVAEYEEYIVDDATAYDKTPSAKDRRMVFLEYVELT